MLKSPRARLIFKLVADHIAADPRTTWRVHFHTADPRDWAIWLWRPGHPLYEYDHWWPVRT
jgi:hypothetical protein